MTTNEELAYMAGVMDSDGYFSIKRSTTRRRNQGDAISPLFHIRAGAKQVQPEAIDLLQSTFPAYKRIDKPTATNGKPLHSWQITDAAAEQFVRTILPFLRIKKRQAEILLDVRAVQSRGREGVYSNEHIDRWGRMKVFQNRCYSDAQIAELDGLYMLIRSINDTRWDVHHVPIR